MQADDLDWRHGDGPVVRGPADPMLLTLTGRRAALEALDGDRLPTLRARVS